MQEEPLAEPQQDISRRLNIIVSKGTDHTRSLS